MQAETTTAPDMIGDVRAFMEAMGQEIPAVPGMPHPDVLKLRKRLLREEFDELLDAITDRDLVEIIDAVHDLCYVAIGTAWACGVNPESSWREVQRSNMQKIGGPMRADGKCMKPDGWTPPDVEGCLRAQGWTGPALAAAGEE